MLTSCTCKVSDKNSERLGEQLQQIETYLGMPETPEDDLEDLDDIRIPGSCGWFTDSTEFQDWVNTPPTTGPKVFWVHAKPATGKSVLASHVISLTQGSNNDCCYYFFRHGDKIRSTLAGCLLSFVYQVSTLNEDVRNKILVMIARGVRFEPDNAKSIWRQIVKPVLSHATTSQPLFWIIDALDECSDVSTFFTIFLKIDPSFPVRIFITSRRTEEIAAGFAQMELTSALAPILSKEIQFRDTQNSILLYLESNKHKLHVGTEQERQALITRMLEKSQGIFLWVRLVLEELSTVWTAKQVEQVLEDVPQEMNLLYSRAVQLIGSRPAHSIAVASAILIWSVCAIRPMTISELQCALELDIGTTVQDPEQAIPSLCSQLVHVDKNGRVLMVHLTAKSFLQERGLESPLTICPILGHRRIACVCLRFLLSDEMKPPSGRRIVDRKRATRKPSMFLKYASFNFAEHMWRTTSDNKVISPLLYEILQKNVFTWIQVMATENSLHVLIHAANLIKNYYQRQTKYFPPLGEQIKLVSAWTVDLHRLVARFGRNMVLQPDSIYSLIPPFCPRSSAVATVFGTPPKCIEVVGLEDNGWDDRLACIDSHDTQAYAVASGEGYFAVGFGSSIDICHSTTCQKWKSLNHGSPIRQLGFDSTGNILISVGRRDVRVWDLEEDSCLATLDVKFDILTFSLRDEAAGFVIALKDHSTVRFTLKTSEVSSGLPWKSAFEDEGEFRRPPLVAAFSPDASLLAVVYRGRPITIWDVEENELCGLIGRENQDLSSLALGANTSPSSLVFNREESLRLLAVAYEDGDLCLFDYDELKLVKTIEAYAQYVACSPDGATLATGDWNGTIQLFEFETLQLLFKVNAADYGIRSLAFSSDNSRLIDARGTQCNIWEPALPSGRLRKDDVSSNRESTEPRIVGISDSEGEITRIETEDQGDWFFAGKSDGTVWLHQTGDGKPNRLLYRHRHGMSVLQLVWGNERNVLVSSDLGGQFIVFSLERDGTGGFRDPIRRIDVKGDVGQVFSISQILLNKSNDLLLVSTAVSDTVWNLDEGRIISSCQFPQRQSFRWLNNPLDNAERILVGAESISVCDWVTCEVKPPRVVSNLALGLMYPKSQTIKSVTKAFNSKLVVELSEFSSESPTDTSLLLEPGQFANGQTPTWSKAFSTICEDLLHLIGTFQSRIVFLDKQLRICSVEFIGGPRPGFRHVNHFFLPADWYSRRRTLLTRITAKGDVLFARGEEVAVIKHGMVVEGNKWEILEE
jgi:WD40 repeat protein